METLLNEIENYWTNRADGYSKVNEHELESQQSEVWITELKRHISDNKELKILDIGTGPGFFAIILAQAGYDVTAVDYTNAMIERAKKNAGEYAKKIKFMQMDAQNLSFADESFDVIVSRNLTWNLENPDKAYSEWTRVLKKGGLLLNFDANWYRYLYDESLKEGYESDRKNTVSAGVEDLYEGTDIDSMESIAKRVPLSRIHRPVWDIKELKKCGMTSVAVNENIWQRVWEESEKINGASTPMFLVKAVK